MALTTTAAARAGNGLGPRTQIIVTDASVADAAALEVITNAIADAHTVAGVAGTFGGVMHIALQGGGDAAASYGGAAVTLVADFNE